MTMTLDLLGEKINLLKTRPNSQLCPHTDRHTHRDAHTHTNFCKHDHVNSSLLKLQTKLLAPQSKSKMETFNDCCWFWCCTHQWPTTMFSSLWYSLALACFGIIRHSLVSFGVIWFAKSCSRLPHCWLSYFSFGFHFSHSCPFVDYSPFSLGITLQRAISSVILCC